MSIAKEIADSNYAIAQQLIKQKLSEKSLAYINQRRGEMLRDYLKTDSQSGE